LIYEFLSTDIILIEHVAWSYKSVQLNWTM